MHKNEKMNNLCKIISTTLYLVMIALFSELMLWTFIYEPGICAALVVAVFGVWLFLDNLTAK